MGTGSNTDSNNIMGETEAIYRQWAQTLLTPAEVTGGFFISRNKSTDSVPAAAAVGSGRDEEIYVVIAKRENMKDRLNKKNWTLTLSGSDGKAGGISTTGSMNQIVLTDDSNTVAATATPAGPRYNIVSGSQGNVSGSGAATKTFGFFYPDQGVMVFSGTELSASIPGTGSQTVKYYDQVTMYASASQILYNKYNLEMKKIKHLFLISVELEQDN